MKDAVAVQAHGLKEAADKSANIVELVAVVPERFPEENEKFLKKAGFDKVLRKPLPVDPKEIQGQLVRNDFLFREQGDGNENNKFAAADETLKYWALALREYDRVLMLDADVMVL